MDNDRAARFENVEQFRLALEGFLRHRGARQLAERADVSRQAMIGHLANEEGAAADAAFAECRFGYRAAIQSWPGFEEAQDRLREVVMLSQGSPEAMHEMLEELLGLEWDEELEPFRYAGEGAAVRWLHKVG